MTFSSSVLLVNLHLEFSNQNFYSKYPINLSKNFQKDHQKIDCLSGFFFSPSKKINQFYFFSICLCRSTSLTCVDSVFNIVIYYGFSSPSEPKSLLSSKCKLIVNVWRSMMSLPVTVNQEWGSFRLVVSCKMCRQRTQGGAKDNTAKDLHRCCSSH